MQVLESLATGVQHGRQWFGPVIDGYAGMVSLLRGELDVAEAQLGTAIANLSATAASGPLPDRYGFSEPLGYAHVHMALQRFLRGDLTGAGTELARAAHRVRATRFPGRGHTPSGTPEWSRSLFVAMPASLIVRSSWLPS